jgi:hypothetical protein
MTIQEIKDLIKLCKREGVKSIKVDGCELSLHEMPVKRSRKAKNGTDNIETDAKFTDEQVLLWSSHG